MKTVFTTREAAKICRMSQREIIHAFDKRELKGFRVPGSKFRRIPRDQLIAFMKANGISTDALQPDISRDLAIWIDPGEAPVEVIQDVLTSLSDLHRAAGGLGLEFSADGKWIVAWEGATA